MFSESPRIHELRRRVESDPSSIAFAQLAEEYRRAGNFEAAEQCCRTGLTRHPAYLSARVTLGRTLIELNKLDEAQSELKQVLDAAPDNLAALRGMAEIHQRLQQTDAALGYYRRAFALAPHDSELEEVVARLNRATAPPASPPLPATEALLDFDALLTSLGISDRPAPPIVEALLDQSKAHSTVGGLESSALDPQSSLDDQPSLDEQFSGLGPECSPTGPEPDWMTGPLPEITASVETEPITPWDWPPAEPPTVDAPVETSATVPEQTLAPDVSPSNLREPLASARATSPAASSPLPREPQMSDVSTSSAGRELDDRILDELEAWLAALKG